MRTRRVESRIDGTGRQRDGHSVVAPASLQPEYLLTGRLVAFQNAELLDRLQQGAIERQQDVARP